MPKSEKNFEKKNFAKHLEIFFNTVNSTLAFSFTLILCLSNSFVMAEFVVLKEEFYF